MLDNYKFPEDDMRKLLPIGYNNYSDLVLSLGYQSSTLKKSMNEAYGTQGFGGFTMSGTWFYPKKVIFHNPATIVYWTDGSKTIVKCQEGDTYDKHTGLAYCFAKKALGNNGHANTILNKLVKEYGDEEN